MNFVVNHVIRRAFAPERPLKRPSRRGRRRRAKARVASPALRRRAPQARGTRATTMSSSTSPARWLLCLLGGAAAIGGVVAFPILLLPLCLGSLCLGSYSRLSPSALQAARRRVQER